MNIKTIAPLLLTTLVLNTYAEDSEELLIIEDEETLIMETDHHDSETIVLEESGEVGSEDDILLIDDGADEREIVETAQDVDLPPSTIAQHTEDRAEKPDGELVFKADNLWAEYGAFSNSNSAADHQGYAHGQATLSWTDGSQWEVQASARVDGYTESGKEDWHDVTIDYDETFIRYKSESSILTVGAQKILWGRIDEFPPTDRLSTQDLRRFVIDDLKDRRLASAAIRYEHFFGNNKIDLMILPAFREAELPDKDSIWYPVNQHTGEILGLETTPALETLIKSTPIKNDEPSSEGGAGLRFSSIGSGLDYGLSVQYGRQTLPYFSYNATDGLIEARYPRSWIVGGDIGVEAFGGTLKFEAAWLGDTPVTRINGTFDTVESVNWGAAWEIFPGDGDGRINLQITGIKLLNASSVLDRTEIYAFNGSYEIPFADNQWRFKTRFFAGLDDKDFYLNPELAYTGWDAQEIYLEAHWFDGDNGTVGGFHEDNTLLTLGWRADF
ncbi:MAG: hypothetical protein KDI24_05730 [Pseudomonadales bacterium]|nr:hypothetical protein [Pseudomonadales bacterium]MCP5172645.1 hypothetical protein [Pseudomonadales bacterium]MCP5302119.1 hypothetical protein [Pseudomonadales bacterium]